MHRTMAGVQLWGLKKMFEEPLYWLKENANLFLDQNVKFKVRNLLITRGFNQVHSVHSMNYTGANDGKLLMLLKKRRMILITFDKHFHKQSLKYNEGMSVLLTKPNLYLESTLSKHIEQNLIHKFKKIREYYLEV